MSIISEIVSNLPIALTAISAMAAAFIAYYNFRSRPILIRTLERHSDDLKTLVKEWKEQLPEIQYIESDFPNKFEVHFPLRVESKLLFADIWEHVPDNISLQAFWAKFREAFRDYCIARLGFMDSISAEVTSRTGLPSFTQFPGRGFSNTVSLHIYRDVFELMKSGMIRWTTRQVQISSGEKYWEAHVSGEMLGSGDRESVKKLVAVYNGIVQEKPFPSDFAKRAEKLIQDELSLRRMRDNLIVVIEEFASIPIYSQSCRYIKWSGAIPVHKLRSRFRLRRFRLRRLRLRR